MSNDKSQICVSCGHKGPAKRITKGSFLLELGLWGSGFFFPLMFLVAFIYSIWRMSSSYKGCKACKSTAVVHEDFVGVQLAIVKKAV